MKLSAARPVYIRYFAPAAAPALAFLSLACGNGQSKTEQPIQDVRIVAKSGIVVDFNLPAAKRIGFASAPEMTSTDANPVTAPMRAVAPEIASSQNFGQAPSQVSGAPAASLAWTAPPGWRAVAPTQFRNPNFVAEAEPKAELYVSRLAGGGGGLAANVNRWRGQFGQPPLDEAAVAALPRTPLLGAQATLVEIRGKFSGMAPGGMAPGSAGGANVIEEAMLRGAAVETGDEGIFIKMTGPAKFIETQTEAFKDFYESMAFKDAPAPLDMQAAAPALSQQEISDSNLPAGHPSIGAAAGAPQGTGRNLSSMTGAQLAPAPAKLAWFKPESWREGPPKPMRSATFFSGGATPAELSLIVLPGEAGGEAANFNRWRAQMSQPPLDAPAMAALPTVAVFGKPAPMIEIEGDFAGMGDAAVEKNYAMLGCIARLGDDRMAFIKMTGPAAAVRAERDNFKDFCTSLQEKADAQ